MKFIKNNYYGLEEIHNINKFLKALPDKTAINSKQVLDAMNVPHASENEDNYVKGSKPYNDILEVKEKKKMANLYLESIGYKKEMVIEENEVRIRIARVSYNETKNVPVDEYDEEDGEMYHYWEERKVEVFFYVSIKYSFFNYKEVNPKELLLDYINKDGVDLIQIEIDQRKLRIAKEIAKRGCEEMELDYSLFEKVFDITKVKYYGLSKIAVMRYEGGEELYAHQVAKIMEDGKKAFSKKYVDGDRIVNYPNLKYMDFLKNPLKEA